MAFTDEEADILQGQASASSAVSMICSITILVQLLKNRRSWSVDRATKELVAILCVIDTLSSAHYLLGGEIGASSETMCDYQGFMIQFWALAGIIWNSCMAHSLLCWIVQKKPQAYLEGMIKWYALVAFGSSLVIAIVLVAKSRFANATLWCWIGADFPELRFYCFYFILLIAWGYNSYVFFRVAHSTRNLLDSNQRSATADVGNKLRFKLQLFIAGFILIWAFGLLNRVLQEVSGQYFWANYLHVFFVPLQGFLNAIIYGGLLESNSAVRVRLRKYWHQCISGGAEEDDEGLLDVEGGLRHSMTDLGSMHKQASVYTVTYNLAESNLEMLRPLGAWIPRGHDMYVISVQECMIIEDLRNAILEHLGGPLMYTYFHNEIGSTNKRLGFHGHIALIVYVRSEEVMSGAFQLLESVNHQVKSGANLGVYTAANKGAVGLPFAYHDATLSFFACHLASDNKGKSRFYVRNKNSRDMLSASTLTDVHTGLDAHLLFHHTICLGDMNYRCRGGPEELLRSVTRAAQKEKKSLGVDDWLAKHASTLLAPEDGTEIEKMHIAEQLKTRREPRRKLTSADDWHGKPPSARELQRMRSPAVAGPCIAAWKELLDLDELTAALQSGAAFDGFGEGTIRFPPSFRRERGDLKGNCGDYSDYDVLKEAYTTKVKDMNAASEERELKRGNRLCVGDGYSLRPPSYTDRILEHTIEDRKDRLSCEAYFICDDVRGSDHRPVASVFNLYLNETVAPGGKAMEGSECLEEPARMYCVTLSDLEIDLLEMEVEPMMQHAIDFEVSEADIEDTGDAYVEPEFRDGVPRTAQGGAAAEDAEDRDSVNLEEAKLGGGSDRAASQAGGARRSSKKGRAGSVVMADTGGKHATEAKIARLDTEITSVSMIFPLPPEDPLGGGAARNAQAAAALLGTAYTSVKTLRTEHGRSSAPWTTATSSARRPPRSGRTCRRARPSCASLRTGARGSGCTRGSSSRERTARRSRRASSACGTSSRSRPRSWTCRCRSASGDRAAGRSRRKPACSW